MASNSLGEKSGHNVSVKKSSLYADCQRRNPDNRFSPLVRMMMSGSGISALHMCARSDSSVMGSDFSASSPAAATISARPPYERHIHAVMQLFPALSASTESISF